MILAIVEALSLKDSAVVALSANVGPTANAPPNAVALAHKTMKPTTQQRWLALKLVALRPSLLQWLTYQAKSAELAEEVLQQGYLQAFEKLHQLKDPRQLKAWFKQILRHKLADEWRRQSRLVPYPEASSENINAIHDPPFDDDSSCACILDLLPRLPENYTQLLKAVDLNEESIQSLSHTLGIRPNNAYVRLSRARQALKKQLKQACGTDSIAACQDCACGENKPQNT